MPLWKVIALNIFLGLLAIALILGLLQLDPLWPFALSVWLVQFAWQLFLLGGTLIIWAAITLARRSGSSGAPGDPTIHLVDSAPYDITRNPIYIGDMILVFGVAFFTRSPSTLVFAIVLPFLFDLYVRKFEEPRTEERLGEAYRAYKQMVPRWFFRWPKDKNDRP